MYLIYIKPDRDRLKATYYGEHNDIEAAREAILDLGDRGIRAFFATEYLGREINVI